MLITHYQFLDSIIKKNYIILAELLQQTGRACHCHKINILIYKNFFLNKIYQSNTEK